MHTRAIARLAAAGVMVGALGLQALPTAAAGSETKQYVATGDATVVNPRAATDGCGAAASPGVGGACFNVAGGSLDILIADQGGGDVNGTYSFKDANGVGIPGGVFCTKTTITVPDTATIMFAGVAVVGPSTGVHIQTTIPPSVSGSPNPQLTQGCGAPKPATTGTITVSGPGAVDAQSSASRAGARRIRSLALRLGAAGTAERQVRGYRPL